MTRRDEILSRLIFTVSVCVWCIGIFTIGYCWGRYDGDGACERLVVRQMELRKR
jgi:hypothetical protein